MVKNINDARAEYKDRIDAIDQFERAIRAMGYQITKHDEFELGAEWSISYDGKQVGSFMWNIPHMLKMEVGDQVFFNEDYLKSFALWKNVTDQCVQILKDKRNDLPTLA